MSNLSEDIINRYLTGQCSEEELIEVNAWMKESEENALRLFRMEEINQRRAEFYQPDNNEVIRRIEDRELRKEIYNAINELPDKCKEVFKLSYLHEMKNKEIADVLGISLRTVEAHMYKALKYLRSRLDPLWIILFLFL